MSDRKPEGGNRRIQRVEKELRDLISSYMVLKLSGEIEGIAAITRVMMSKDLRSARVLVYNQSGEKVAKENVDVLQANAHQINQFINSQVRMKYSPKIKFFVDTKFDDAMRVQIELRKLELERLESEKDSNNEDE
jgi:ribosome-binding factor A